VDEQGRTELIETVRSAYEAFNQGDFDRAAGFLHPDIVWNRVAEIEDPLRGAEAAREFMEPQAFSSQSTEIHSIEMVGDEYVLVDGTFHGEGASSGIAVNQRGLHLWRFKDARAIEFRYFRDREEALAAARG
jgi:ketosteroid isomerase-like protein